jgi:class 3 adenylate cyclase
MLVRMPVCPVCATENPDVARFCLSCGAALTAEPPREERKVVTVLFADLVGFTSRAEQLDPEDVRAVLAPYWERLRHELEKRGGTVEKFIGDAVMALFGAPAAHDDDPLRAVGAALAIRDWAREESDVQVRIAVNTGEALVLLGARPAEGEGMAAGDVVNATSRLQAAAPVNGVLVGETTYRATRDVVEYVEHAAVVAKGKAEPIPVWEAVQARSRLGIDVERATLPLVGRRRELGVIVDAFERAKSEREPQLVTLVGVPGIGKSRLVGELFAQLEGLPDLVWWRQGRALPYGEGVSFWALAEMVKAQAGIQENDTPESAETKLRESVARVVDEDERDWVVEHLLPLVGGEPRAGSGESAPAWRRYFEGMAEQRPLVMVFEDMHWADDGLLDFIDHVVDWASGVPILVLATARPELLDRRQAWGGGKLNVSTIALTPLSDEEAAQIIHGVLEQAALPAETQLALLERAGGNPLYAEQFARLYMERRSAEDLPLPETVQGLIAARLDGLPAGEKRLVQDASVFGKVFWAGALDADEQALHSLERNGMLRRERRSAVAGETQYAFRHVLVRDVAYGQIPRAARGEKHVRAARWIESLGRAEDHAELVAHHFGAALELGLDVAAPTRRACARAGRRSEALGAWPSAERYFSTALALWPRDDPELPRLQAAHARSVARTSGETEPLAAAVAALEAAGLLEDAAELASFAAQSEWYRGAHDVAAAYMARGKALLAAAPPSRALAALLAEEARLAVLGNRYDEGKSAAAAALDLATQLGLDEERAAVLNTLSTLKFIEGDLAESDRLLEQIFGIVAPGSYQQFRALANYAITASAEGDRDAWLPRWERALEAATRAGDRSSILWLESSGIADALDVGRWDEALRRADSFLAQGPHYLDHHILLHKAIVLAARGERAEALALRDRALEAASRTEEHQVVIPSRLISAGVSLLADDPSRARELVAEAELVAVDLAYRAPGIGAFIATTIARTGRSEAWLAIHSRAAATRRIVATRLLWSGDVVEAADAWARVSPHDEALARLHAARVLVGKGLRTEARAQLERGLAFFRAVGATKVVGDAESQLAAAAAAE